MKGTGGGGGTTVFFATYVGTMLFKNNKFKNVFCDIYYYMKLLSDFLLF